jgi:hypothetical protein
MAFSLVMMMPSLASVRMDEQRRWNTVTATDLLRRYDGFSITVKYKCRYRHCVFF